MKLDEMDLNDIFRTFHQMQKISMRSISNSVSFKNCVSLLIFCFGDLSIGVNGGIKSPTVIVLLSISPLCLLVFFFFPVMHF